MMEQRLHWIDPTSPPDAFPAIDTALREPDGLLAVGGDLSCERLLAAYPRGIFPWFADAQPILWWSPDPRCVLVPPDFHVARSLRRTINGSGFRVAYNLAFEAVMRACAAPRRHQDGTWITEEMVEAYTQLHKLGYAHSVEVYAEDRLVGGMYGLAIGKVFFGESMFSIATNASKIAMYALCHELEQRDFALLDCQVESPHLISLGAKRIPRAAFRSILDAACADRGLEAPWPDEAIAIETLRNDA